MTSAVSIEYARIVLETQPDCSASVKLRVALNESVDFFDTPSIFIDKSKIGVTVFARYQF